MNERKVAPYLYQPGVIDCFNEMVAAGVERMIREVTGGGR